MPDPTRNQLIALAIIVVGLFGFFALLTVVELAQAGAL